MSHKIYISLIGCLLILLNSCTSKRNISLENNSSANTHENGFYALFVFHNNTLSKTSSIIKTVEDAFQVSMFKRSIYFKNTPVLDVDGLDKKFSYLIDYFKDEKEQFLIISEVNSDDFQSSSDTNILPRNKLLICDLKTNKKYQYIYTSSRHSLILPLRYYKNLPEGTTIKSIDTSAKTIVFEKKDRAIVEIKVSMVEVKKK